VSTGSPAARDSGPRTRKRWPRLVGAAVAAVALAGYVVAARAPTYSPPGDDEIRILLELAGVFPDKYAIEWREHGSLTSADARAQGVPELLRGAMFMHQLRTAGSRADGELYVEATYSYFAHDHEIDLDDALPGKESRIEDERLAADAAVYGCWCDPQAPPHAPTRCYAALAFGNYEFSLSADYNGDQCSAQTAAQRRADFLKAARTADQLIHLYLEPLRRKPRWL
jgi:hypothetical protein